MDGTVNRMIMQGRGSIVLPRTIRVEYLHVDESSPRSVDVLDGYLMGALHWAMAIGDPLVVGGPVTRAALRNADALMEIWESWVPDRYRRIDIRPDTVVDAPAGALWEGDGERAIAAFSGGVDSTFTLLRHVTGSPVAWPYEVRDSVMVHGFDVPLHDRSAFEGLVRRTDPLLEALGVQRHVVRTNVREWPELDWEQTYGAQLACVLHQFSGEFTHGLIAGGPHYLSRWTGWGSTALTDPLLSGARMAIVHDGAAFTRIPKVSVIAGHDVAKASVKVCWQGPSPERNCGTCEKCLRTRLSFLAVGETEPGCFDGSLDLGAIRRISVHNHHGLRDLHRIVDYCDAHGVEGHWLDALRSRLDELDASHVAGGPGGRRRVRAAGARRTLRRLRMRARVAARGATRLSRSADRPES